MQQTVGQLTNPCQQRHDEAKECIQNASKQQQDRMTSAWNHVMLGTQPGTDMLSLLLNT